MRRLVATVVAAALFVATFLSPVADVIVGSLSIPWRPVGTIQDLNYNTSPERLLGDSAYRTITRRTPPGVTSAYVMGSSDFWADMPQNPRTFLTQHVRGFDMYSSGADGTEVLNHAIELAAMADDIRPHKAVLMLAPQWFSSEGVAATYVHQRFSLALWKEMGSNPRLSATTRNRLEARTLTLAPQLCDELLDCPGHSDASPLTPLDRALRTRGEQLREAWNERRIVRAFDSDYPDRPDLPSIDSLDWDAELQHATEYGQQTSHNSLFIDDRAYQQARSKIEANQSPFATRYAPDSPSYDDLDLFLQVSEEVGLDVMVVVQPVNGLWEDRAGFSRADRQAQYQRIRDIVGRHRAEVLDLSSHEYDPYFFTDTIHLGPKGWLHVIHGTYLFARS